MSISILNRGGASGGLTASIFVNGLHEDFAVTATKDGKTLSGKWTSKPNPKYRLPDGYTQVDYIESTGTQHLNTDVIPTKNTKIEVEVSDWPASEVSTSLLGASTTGNRYEIFISSNSTYRSYYGGSYKDFSGVSCTGKTTIIKDGAIASIGGVSVTNTEKDFTLTIPLFLFALNSSGSPVRRAELRLYSCKISENENLIRDYVPCINPDGKCGLYDLVTETFFGNAGTGEFIAGAEIPRYIYGHEITRIKSTGTWTVTGTKGNTTLTREVLVDVIGLYEIDMMHGVIYENGVEGVPLAYSVTASSGICENDGSNIVMRYARGQSQGNYNSYAEAVVATTDLVDLSGYEALHISGELIVRPGYLDVHYNETSIVLPTNSAGGLRGDVKEFYGSKPSSNGSFHIVCDISALYYVRLYICAMTDSSTGGGSTPHMTISKIWLE